MILLNVSNISKSFDTPLGKIQVLKNINFSLNKAEIVGIRGENGSGKTTLFNIIAGINVPDSGEINIINDDDRLSTVGVVFQNYTSTLLPWANIRDNILLPLRVRHYSKNRMEEKLNELLNKLNFTNIPLWNYPHQLSGGQKQKVAIARAMIQDPDILILDEPFANLDFRTSMDLQDIILQIHNTSNVSILLVSHNIDHILYLADKIFILGEHPSTLINESSINLPKPRTRFTLISEEFEKLRNKILEFEYAAYQQNDK